MKAPAVSYAPALDALVRYRDARAATLTPEDRETVDEIGRRLRRLQAQASELIEVNNVLVEAEVPKTEFDPSTDTLTFRAGDTSLSVQLRRADPNVPITMKTLTAGAGYKAGADPPGDQSRIKFEGQVEHYYYDAHRVLKLVKTLPGLKRFSCREITIVRNKLVEHPDKGEPYSFGFGSTGPRIRPMHRKGRLWHDEGLVPNTEAFVSRLANALEKSA